MTGIKMPGPAKERHPLLVLEDALVLCGFGRFHYKLMLATLASTFASVVVMTTSSYLLPNAQCDLNMTLMQKGLLNAAPFIGFIITAFLSRIFVDGLGRKKVLVYGHAAVFVFTLLEASSQNYWSLVLMKVLAGASLMLGLIAMLTIVVEFTHSGLRERIGMFVVSLTPLANIGCALLAWGLLPHHNWHFIIWKGYFELRAWNIYLYVCSVFSLLATILYCTIPESPKYLLFRGKEVQALEILKDLYSENTGIDRDSFPIKTLGSLRLLFPHNTVRTLINIYIRVLKKILKRPFVYQIMLLSWISFISHMVSGTIRSWYPQISTIVEYYRKENGNTDRFCTMLNNYTHSFNMGNTDANDCIPTISGPETYINNIVVALISFFAINFTGYLVEFFGHKLLMFVLFILCSLATAVLYLSSTSNEIALLIAAMCAFLQAIFALQKTMLATFPRALKTVGLSIVLIWSRVGVLVGNILFPLLLQIDCAVPLLFFSSIVLGTSALVFIVFFVW